jgi:hypothetical protein
MFFFLAKTKGLDFKIEVEQDVPGCALGDGRKILQVLINLIGNAIKYTDNGLVSLKISYDEVNNFFIFLVRDTGPGINEEMCDRMFSPFVQSRESCEKNGTGLGLSISRSYARLMGGDLVVESVVGEGAAFCFTCHCPVAESQSHFIEYEAPLSFAGKMDRPVRITTEDLTSLPESFFVSLHKECLLGDQEGMERTVALQQNLDERLATELRHLVSNFRFDVILELITPHLETT